MMNFFLLGAVMMADLTIGLFFLRFWRKTKDRFFLFFSLSFTIQGIQRIILALPWFSDEQEPLIYLIRFTAYVMILLAIVDKNRSRSKAA